MNDNIYLPKKINVGFQNRNGTYTGQLAYIIYFDKNGILRKETSWNSWRNQKIPNQEFDNVPTEGFVLNKKVGGNDTGWNHRNTYCRVYDPRGFEFEINVENLLYILENTSCIKGKGLSGNFIYGWSGKDLILIPTDSPDYAQLESYNSKIHSLEKFSLKKMKIGGRYLTNENKTWIYLGHFQRYDYAWGVTERHIAIPKGKHFYFWSEERKVVEIVKTISSKIIACVSEDCVENYSELMDKLERNSEYRPKDPTKNCKKYYTLEEVTRLFNVGSGSIHSQEFEERLDAQLPMVAVNTPNSYGYCRGDDRKRIVYYKDQNAVIYSKGYTWSREIPKQHVSLGTIEEFVNTYKPYYIERYLTNGIPYEGRNRRSFADGTNYNNWDMTEEQDIEENEDC
jgi:hypothetical protein